MLSFTHRRLQMIQFLLVCGPVHLTGKCIDGKSWTIHANNSQSGEDIRGDITPEDLSKIMLSAMNADDLMVAVDNNC